jgi:4-diphosphocytidyl-2-C-methyl-D-erythritol kinase
MISFPNCKINLGLQVLRKRTDGYHDLSTIFYPLPLKDILEILHSDSNRFTAYGHPIPGNGNKNSCEEAWQLLKTDFPTLPNVHIHLYKNIPIGAGLGGGSADGAFTLLALNQQFHLGLDTPALLHYGARLGSDCPFFILNKPCLGTGRGEQLEPLALDLSPYNIVLVNPGIHISTAEAFARCTPHEATISLRDIVRQPVHTWPQQLTNDFEEPVFQLHPTLREIKATLYAQGALYAALTGSGSSLYGIFEKAGTPTALPLSWNYHILR